MRVKDSAAEKEKLNLFDLFLRLKHGGRWNLLQSQEYRFWPK